MTAASADSILDGLSGEYRLGLREGIGAAFNGFWRSMLASSIVLYFVMLPILFGTAPWVLRIRDSGWLGGAVNFGAFGIALGYAYVCASTKYVFDAQGVHTVRGWPSPRTVVSRPEIVTARVVKGLCRPLLRLDLRSGRVVELVLSPRVITTLDGKRASDPRAAQQGHEADER